MKIGIVTFLNDLNYGCIFQAYALQKVLKNLGYKSEILDYWHSENNESLNGINFKSSVKISSKIRFLITNIFFSKFINKSRSKNTRLFIEKNIVISKNIYKSDEELKDNDKYNVYITGSDQIWNPVLHKKAFSLFFVSDKKKKIAYAGSFGTNKIPLEKNLYYKKLFKNYTYVSARESIGSDIIYRITGKRVPVVLDPTLLLNSEDFILNSNNNINNKYIFCYWLGDIIKLFPILNLISIKNNINIYFLSPKKNIVDFLPFKKIYRIFKINKILFKNNKIKLMLNSDPYDFLKLISNASFVITDSFHGTALSIIFKKSFSSYASEEKIKNGKASRMIDLLQKLNLYNLFNKDLNNLYNKQISINWEIVYKNLEKYKNESLNYLKKALKDI